MAFQTLRKGCRVPQCGVANAHCPAKPNQALSWQGFAWVRTPHRLEPAPDRDTGGSE